MSNTSAALRQRPTSIPLLNLQRDLAEQAGSTIERFTVGSSSCELRATPDSILCLIRREGAGGLAWRAAYIPMPFQAKRLKPKRGEAARVSVSSAMGRHEIAFTAITGDLDLLRVQTVLTPRSRLRLPFVPRDLYPLDDNDDPLASKGKIEARQRGVNAGLVYLTHQQPAFGKVLYFQNLTSLNAYFNATGTSPRDIVGGTWPECGMLLPTAEDNQDPWAGTLPPATPVTLTDAFVVIRQAAGEEESENARQFLQMLGAVYSQIDHPATRYRDWTGRSRRTLRDLARAPAATTTHYGHKYVHPYTAAEYPDSMVQLTVLAAVHDWSCWQQRKHPLEDELAAGLNRFHDRELGALRRYLPSVGDDKNADAVDSWYLYHPLLNLARLALGGRADARRLLLDCLPFGIKAAHHFRYRWPVQYDVKTFAVITMNAPADGRGQTDVGGIYAYLMLQAFALTDDKQYLDEARAALEAAMGLRFHLNYQANLTAWGAAACMRMWRITDDPAYRDLAYIYLASFFHNAVIWHSELGHARHYEVFLGVTCLQDAPYMAMYECFDSFAAFERLLADCGPDFEPAARTLVADYCKYAPSRAWSYYPDALPPEAIAPKQRENNGYIDRALSFPLEDLYPDGQPAGQVGQEVYGAGAAMVFATRLYHRVDGAPFQLFCNQFVRSLERPGERVLRMGLDGGTGCTADIVLTTKPRRRLPTARVQLEDGTVIKPKRKDKQRIAFEVPAACTVTLLWDQS